MASRTSFLPGDMRDILNQVVTAEKQAQANLIRRREETRLQGRCPNTARLDGEQPAAGATQELETLEKIAEKVTRSPSAASIVCSRTSLH